MTQQQQIIDGNRLIAEFMGESSPYPDERMYITVCRYHDLWDWLMPSWGKVGHELYECRKELTKEKYLQAHSATKTFLHGCQTYDIAEAWQGVIEAIEIVNWYNKTKEA